MTNSEEKRPEGNIVLYQPTGSGAIRVLLEGETAWLTQRLIADLYQTKRSERKSTYHKHLRGRRTVPRGNY